MKTAFLLVLLVASMASAQVLAQTEPTPAATPAPSPAATRAAGQEAACESCEKHAVTTAAAADEEATLTKLEQDWGDAIARHDVAFLERLEADDYIYTGPDGVVAHKADDLAGARAAFAQIESFTHRGIKVQVYGDTAVVTGATTLKAAAANVDLSGEFRWTDVFVKRDRQWRVVASQATPISRTAPEG